MKRSLYLAAVICSYPLSAQVVLNGDFQDVDLNPDLSSWNATCGQLITSPDDHNGVGWSAGVPVDQEGTCFGITPYSIGYQAVPAMGAQETWTLSGWVKMPITAYGAALSVMDANFTLAAVAINANDLHEWTYLEATGNTNTLCPCVVALNAGSGDPGTYVLYDDIQLLGPTTAIGSNERSVPKFRPNPAADKLWVDLPTPPLSAEILDMRGLSVLKPVMAHADHTLMVSVASLPPGLYELVMRTAEGARALRFVKA